MRLKCSLVSSSLVTFLLCSAITIPTKILKSVNKSAMAVSDYDYHTPSYAGREL